MSYWLGPKFRRPARPISVSAVPFGIDIWRSCRFSGCLMRSLCVGGLGRFVPWRIRADHCRLRHIGREKCGHGLNFQGERDCWSDLS